MKTFPLVISSPDGDVFREQVIKISLRGTEGDLAVLAGHVPFVTTVKPGTVEITKADESVLSGTVDGGILTVSSEGTTLISGTFQENKI